MLTYVEVHNLYFNIRTWIFYIYPARLVENLAWLLFLYCSIWRVINNFFREDKDGFFYEAFLFCLHNPNNDCIGPSL